MLFTRHDAVDNAGKLLLMSAGGRLVSKSVELQGHTAYALAACKQYVAVGLSNGAAHVFDASSLALLAVLPGLVAPAGTDAREAAAAALGSSGSAGQGGSNQEAAGSACFSLSFGPQLDVLAAAYEDRSLVLWDIQDLSQASRG